MAIQEVNMTEFLSSAYDGDVWHVMGKFHCQTDVTVDGEDRILSGLRVPVTAHGVMCG